ncbi:MAG: hypothetical protein HY552_04520 [Elusimicrobia bacterium]|nr:hypothetical protein [Elusimicrobiota bacterium]
MKQNLPAVLCAALLLAPAVPALAADAAGPRLSELEQKVDALTQEIEKLKLGETAAPQELKPQDGLGPAAAKVYGARPDKLSLGGYGEIVYIGASRRRQDGNPSGAKRQSDLQRLVLYVGHKFNDWLLFNSELEFEHGGSGEGAKIRGEVAVEQAYIEARPWRALGARVGNLLVPLGLINEIHEPTSFHGVQRPNVERSIIPSTWHENGVGVLGDIGPVSYRSYLLSNLSAVASASPAADGFTASGIRGGRTAGSRSPSNDIAWASRVDVTPIPGVTAGAGLYLDRADTGGAASSFPVTLWEAHASADWRGASLRGLYAQTSVGNADALNAAQGFVGNTSVGGRQFGGYAEGAFDVLTLLRDAKGQSLSPFFRYERFDTQWKVPAGFSKNPANSRVEYTLGLTYKPISRLALKLDQQWKLNQARTSVNQWNFGVGYIF